MSILNGLLGQVSDNATVQNLAAKVGLSSEQVEQAVAALGAAPCKDAKGKFVKCPEKKAAAKPKQCRDAKGHYAKCK